MKSYFTFLRSIIIFSLWTFVINQETDMGLFLKSSKVHASRGEEVNITCRVVTTKPTVIVWSRDNETFSDFAPWDKARVTLKMLDPDLDDPNDLLIYKSVLVIHPTKQHTYTCEATSEVVKTHSVITVFVGDKPEIVSVKMKPTTPQPRGRNVTATCRVRSFKKPILTWYYVDDFDTPEKGVEVDDSFEIDEYTEMLAHNETLYVSRLFLFPVTVDANYSCSAKNIYGTRLQRVQVTTVDVFIGELCLVDLDCNGTTKRSTCEDKKCVCPFRHRIHIKKSHECLPPVMFREPCKHNDQCIALDKHTYCTLDGRETCQCADGFVYSMDQQACIVADTEEAYLTVLFAIGASLVIIVTATLTLYFTRKSKEKKKRLAKLMESNRKIEEQVNSAVDEEDSLEEADNEKKVHFTQ